MWIFLIHMRIVYPGGLLSAKTHFAVRVDKNIISWQGFQNVVRTMRWDDTVIMSDAELAEIEEDIRQIRKLLEET